MAVIVTSAVTSSGSTITGNTVHIVIVKTSGSYAPDPRPRVAWRCRLSARYG